MENGDYEIIVKPLDEIFNKKKELFYKNRCRRT